MKKYTNFGKTFLFTILAIVCFAGNIDAENITGKITGSNSSTTVDFLNPPGFMLDGDDATVCGFTQDSSYGWIELSLDREMEIFGLELDGSAPSEDLNMRIEYRDVDGWKPFSLSNPGKSDLFSSFIDISYDRVVCDSLRLVFFGTALKGTRINSLSLKGSDPREYLHKVVVKEIVSSNNSSHFYSADYLVDNNARTRWNAFPGILRKFTDNFDRNNIEKLNEVEIEKDRLLESDPLSGLYDSFYFKMDAELVLETPEVLEYINLYFTEENRGDFTLSVYSGNQWSDIYAAKDGDITQAGWKHIPVDPIYGQVEKARVIFDGNRIMLGGLGEIELWGKGSYRGKDINSIPVPEGTTLAKPVFFSTNLESDSGYNIDVELGGHQGASIILEFNGKEYEALRKVGRFDNNIYSVSIERDFIWDDGNYISIPLINENVTVEAVRFVSNDYYEYPLLDSGLNDRFLFSADGEETSTVYDLGRDEYINKLNIYSLDNDYSSVKLFENGTWENISDFSIGDGFTSFNIFRNGNRLLLEKSLYSGVGEAEILGSPIETGAPEVRIIWPEEGDILARRFTTFSYIKGFIDNPEATVIVNGKDVRQCGHTFWIPMHGMEVDEDGTLVLTAEAVDPDGMVSTHEIQVFEDGYGRVYITPDDETIFTDDEEITFGIKTPPGIKLVIDNGSETWNSNGSMWGTEETIPLEEGLNLLTIRGFHWYRGKLSSIVRKKVIRNSTDISVDVFTPSQNSWLSRESIVLEGSVNGSGKCRVTINGDPAVMEGNYFRSNPVLLSEGENRIEILAEDSAGRMKGIEHILYNDTTAPVINVETPVDNTFFNKGYFEVSGTVQDSNQTAVLVGGQRLEVVDGRFTTQLNYTVEGEFQLEFSAVDIGGNSSEPVFKKIIIDTSAPLPFEIISDRESWTNSSPTLTFGTTDGISGVSHYEISVNGEDYKQVSSPYTVPLTVDGELKVFVKAMDNVGNFRTSETYIYIDTTPPATPPNFRGVPGNGMAEARWDASDEDVVEYRITRHEEDGEVILTTSELFCVDEELENGDNVQYSLVAVDRAGNLSETAIAEPVIIGVAEFVIDNESEEVVTVEYATSNIHIPPSSLPEEVRKVVVSEIVSEELEEIAAYEIVSPIYDYSVIVEDNGDEVYQEHVSFNEPYLGEIVYDQSMIPSEFPENKLDVYYFDSNWSMWKKVKNCIVDEENNRISFTSDHFSLFSVQPTIMEDVSPQELTDSAISPLDSATAYKGISVSPQGGSAATEVTELVLPGAGGFNFELKRVYNTGNASSDNYASSIFGSVKHSVDDFRVDSIDDVLDWNSQKKQLSKARYSVLDSLQGSGDYGLSMGMGWRLDLPYVKRGSESYMIRLPDGSVHSIDSMEYIGVKYDGEWKRILEFEMHEGADFKLEVYQTQKQYYRYYYTDETCKKTVKKVAHRKRQVSSSKLTLKDGTVWVFGKTGNVYSVTDPAGVNKLVFGYGSHSVPEEDDDEKKHKGFILKSIKLDILEEGAEAQEWTILIDHNTEKFFIPVISEITVETNEDKTRDRTISYEIEPDDDSLYAAQFLPLLKTAKDVGSRESSYGYISHEFASHTFDKKYQTVFLMSEMGAPGKGYTEIDYSFPYLKDGFNKKDKIIVNSVKTYGKVNEPLQTDTKYTYDFKYIDHDQFVNMRTTEDDGRIHRVYNYSTTEKRRINWKRYAAKRDDFLKEFWYYEYDILPYNTSITTTNILTGKLFETSEMAYDLDTMRMISEKSTRTADNYRSSEFEYDKWGNRIYSKDYNQVLDEKTGKFRKNETETWSHFLNGETDRFENDNLKAYPYSDSGLTNAGTRNLPLQTLVKNNIPNEDGTYSSQYINTAWEYNSLGQRTGQREWIDGVPSSTSFEYDSYGNVNKITNPLGHITTFDYNYSPDPVKYPDSYTITKTEKDVVFAADETVFPTDPAILTNSENRDNYTADIVLTSVIENRTGWMILDINPEGNETSYKYDLLGRTVETEFEDSITTIEFDDTELKTTVTKVTGVDPETNVKEGSVSVYDYDTLGRLVSVAKDVREITGIFKRGEDQSVYTLGYDNWGNVTSLKDPNQNTTTYEYDGMNRLKKVVHPAEDGVIYTREMDFDYRTNTQRVENEEGQVSYEFYDYSGRLIKHSRRWELEDIETFSYFDGLGNEVRRIDENGNSTTIEYNERNQPVETILPEEEFFENYVPVSLKPYSRTKYNLAGQKTSDIISTPDSRYADNATDTEYEYGITYEYDGLGRVISTSKPFFRNLVDDEVDDEVLTYIKEYSFYNGNGNVIKTIDGNGKESRFTYTNRGQVLSEINPEDGIVSYTYDLKDRKLSMTDSRGNSLKYPDKDFNIIYHYDDLDRLIGAQLPKSISSPNDKPVVKFTYDIKGNVLEQVNPDGGVTSFSYSPRNNKLTETVSGQTLGGVDREYTNRFTYDGLKNVKTVTDAGGNVTTNYYDLLGRLTDVSRPEGNNEYYKYDKVGNVVLTGDGKGNETESEYDAYNRVKKIIDAANGETEIKYDRLGNQTRYIDAKDNATNYVYDELNRIISETNARNEIHSFTYDSVGNIITHTDPMGTVATYTYTDLYLQDSLVLKNADESITKTITNGWDEAGDIIWSDDDGIKIYYNGYDGTEGSYSPDPYSRVMDITRVIDGKNITTGYKYDVMNRVKALVYPSGRTVEYKYNNLSQLEEVPGYIDDTIEYDSRGFLTEYMNNAGITATFDYDASSRQTDISYENSSDDILKSFNFDYDTANNISRKNNSSYTYDVLNRMKTSNESGKFAVDVEKRKQENPEYSQKIGVAEFDIAGQKSLDFETDKVELLLDYASTSIGVDLGDSGTYISHLKIKPESIGHRIDSTNLEIFISSSNFDEGYEKLTDWKMEEEDGVITITFRDPVFGNYIKIHSQFDERDDENNPVDLATIRNSKRELLTVFYMANIQNGEFEYDSKGNRTSSSSETMLYTTLEESDGKTYTYYPDSDRLKTVESTNDPDEKTEESEIEPDEITAYVWNLNGNMVEKGSVYSLVENLPVIEKTGDYTKYEYDLLNRLIQVSKIDENDELNVVASYTYDSKGYRIKKVGKDSTEYFAFSLDGLLLREENVEDPGLTTEYIYAFNKVIAERRGTEDFFYLTDHLGSTVMLTDVDGNVVWQNDFTPFGEETGESGYLKRTGMYTSKKIDPDTGLYYFNARWYDASLGKFITEDPVKDGVNWYVYCSNNPLNRTDPTGLREIIEGSMGNNDELSVVRSRNAKNCFQILNGVPVLSGYQVVSGGRRHPNRSSVAVVNSYLGNDYPLKKEIERFGDNVTANLGLMIEERAVRDEPFLAELQAAFGGIAAGIIEVADKGLGIFYRNKTKISPIDVPEHQLNDILPQGGYSVEQDMMYSPRIDLNLVSNLHKNNNNYIGPQAVYQITIDGILQKYGKADMTNLSSTGRPRRLQNQLNALQELNPTSEVLGNVLAKYESISTLNIKKIETAYIQQYYDVNGSLPPGNQNHPGIIYKE